jgi:hypothetical protein
MSIWKIFSKHKKEIINTETQDKIKEPSCGDLEEDKPIAKYSETLYTGVRKSKKTKKVPSSDQRIWRDLELIEEKIDNLHTKLVKKKSSEIEKKIDNLVSGIKIEKSKNKEKPSTIIYIQKKPKQDKLRGNWTVQSKGSIFSHHKIKENAILKAKKIARKNKAKIMIQKTGKSFSEIS